MDCRPLLDVAAGLLRVVGWTPLTCWMMRFGKESELFSEALRSDFLLSGFDARWELEKRRVHGCAKGVNVAG